MTIMAELWQFVSRSDMTRDNMSQALGAWGLGLFFIIPDPRVVGYILCIFMCTYIQPQLY